MSDEFWIGLGIGFYVYGCGMWFMYWYLDFTGRLKKKV